MSVASLTLVVSVLLMLTAEVRFARVAPSAKSRIQRGNEVEIGMMRQGSENRNDSANTIIGKKKL